MDKRVYPRSYIFQHGIHDQRAHVPHGKARYIPASVRPFKAESSLEMGNRHDARQAGQPNDPKVDATV